MTDIPLLNVEVITPDQVLFKGQANAVSAFNVSGPFDILPQHSHFISLIQKEVSIHQFQKVSKFPINMGVIRCFNDDIKVYIGIESVSSSVEKTQNQTPPTNASKT